jgi:hypothetical protein
VFSCGGAIEKVFELWLGSEYQIDLTKQLEGAAQRDGGFQKWVDAKYLVVMLAVGLRLESFCRALYLGADGQGGLRASAAALLGNAALLPAPTPRQNTLFHLFRHKPSGQAPRESVGLKQKCPEAYQQRVHNANCRGDDNTVLYSY